ncbi:hypothetical protein MJO28_003698 [Puccinia striiformis f. sp. tritici]|uniref:Uncharacterized protein n=2 Tax=Puccinia striiformis TaxID=27350 RepID=A0A2S4UKS4_9BASI|nr:hypothetical protein MJO29_016724 [Puccinia striiformis f. sp. tritici]KAI7956603.1 hypothetical protein MJO28_003698 [Puccinia striiformis f. sp. tritici]POV97870.1 hypothetical protein PSTT_14782 [Puccinia striiformis]
MADSLRGQDNWRLFTKAKMMISMAHEGLDCVPRLARTDAIDYYNQRIVLCKQEVTIRLANQYLLGKIKGPCKLLTTSQTTQERGLHRTYTNTTVGSMVPDNIIQVKRGMVLRILDNVGHESYLNINHRVLLLQISRDTLTVTPIDGSRKGMDVILRRLVYGGLSSEGVLNAGSFIQYPVMGGFAEIET